MLTEVCEEPERWSKPWTRNQGGVSKQLERPP
jgi:hypothetical protein